MEMGKEKGPLWEKADAYRGSLHLSCQLQAPRSPPAFGEGPLTATPCPSWGSAAPPNHPQGPPAIWTPKRILSVAKAPLESASGTLWCLTEAPGGP